MERYRKQNHNNKKKKSSTAWRVAKGVTKYLAFPLAGVAGGVSTGYYGPLVAAGFAPVAYKIPVVGPYATMGGAGLGGLYYGAQRAANWAKPRFANQLAAANGWNAKLNEPFIKPNETWANLSLWEKGASRFQKGRGQSVLYHDWRRQKIKNDKYENAIFNHLKAAKRNNATYNTIDNVLQKPEVKHIIDKALDVYTNALYMPLNNTKVANNKKNIRRAVNILSQRKKISSTEKIYIDNFLNSIFASTRANKGKFKSK